MEDVMTGQTNLTGGCQCGAVRYTWLEPPKYASVCYCRMCQKASGQPFMALAGGKRETLRWTRGEPAIFNSSNMAERGFCSACGTPLTYSFEGTSNISVTMCSLDDPEAIRPSKQYGIESKVSWFDGIGSLPAERTDAWLKPEVAAQLVNHQYPDHDTPQPR
jgi:hypothetical protein